MIGNRGLTGSFITFCGTLTLLATLAPGAGAGERARLFRRGPVTTVPTVQVRTAPPANRPVEPLGTFTRTPYIFVRGNGPAGGGYSPLGEFGDASMSIYGPLSAFRMTSAPVLTYSRGYNGQPVLTPGTSFSAPNLPSLTPVVYPTQATNYYGPRQLKTPPWWANGINWIDQN
jgi:hypothetical protein